MRFLLTKLTFLTAAMMCLAFLSVVNVNAQTITCRNITNTTTSTSENFDGLANAGNTNTVVPAGFGFAETGENGNTTYTGGTGSSATGDTYSFGAAASTDRAFGGLRSSTLVPTIGGCIRNNGTTTITAITINYTGEEWRLGTTGRADRLDFQYSLTAISLATGTYTDFNALDFATPTTTGATGAKDGNVAANRTVVAAQTIAVTIPVNGTFYFRYTDLDAAGADDGLAVDDFTLSSTFAAAVTPTLTVAPASLAFGDVTVGSVSTPQSYMLMGSNLTGSVTVTAPSGYQVSTDSVTGFGASVTVAPVSGSVNTTIYVRFAPTAAGANTGNVTNVSSGATTQNVAVSGNGVAANNAPTITATPAAQTVESGAAGSSTIGITDEDAANVVLTVSSNNTALVPNANIALSGTGNSRTLTATSVAGQIGTAVITVTATDGGGLTGTATFTLTVNAPTIAVAPAALPDGTVGAAYNQTITATGGAPNYTFAVTAGSLPTGLTLSSVGVLSGTPTAAGTFNFTVTATDQNGFTGSRAYTVTINDAPPTLTINDVALTEGNAGTTTYAFTVSLSAAAQAGGVTFDIATADGTATAASGDYAANALTGQTIAAGGSTYTFNVTVNGDAVSEPNETFFVNVSNVTGATVVDAQGLGTISNDDAGDMTAPVIAYTPLPAKNDGDGSTLVVTVTDNVEVQNVSIVYTLNGVTTTTVCPVNGGDTYSCQIIEANATGQTISYYVTATDAAGNAGSLPAMNTPNGYAVGSATVAAGTYTNLNLNGGAFSGSATVLAAFGFNSVVSAGGNTLTIDCGGTINRGYGNAVIVGGSVRKNLCGAQTFVFPVGSPIFVPSRGITAIYSPVTANVTAAANPSSLTVSVTDDFLDGSNQPSSVSRYWSLTETGAITADLSFTYDQSSDVNGNEATYKVLKNEGLTTSIFNDSENDPATNTATVMGISDFSDWSVGALAPTAATVDLSGVITNPRGRRLEYVTVTLSGGSLDEPLAFTTDISGRFRFTEIPANETYILTVRSKRYRFSQPSRVFSVNGNLTNISFVSEN